MTRRTPAQLYSLLFGAALLLAGILGFFWSGDFSVGSATEQPENRAPLLGLFDVNGWHNLVHLASGLVGLVAARARDSARLFALGFGSVYLVVVVLGFIVGDGGSILGLVPINTEDNVLHVVIAVAGLVAGALTPAVPAPTTMQSHT